MKKKWLIVVISCTAAMFIWIFVAVALTGGREPSDFTAQDKRIMAAFIVVELLTVAGALVSAVMLGRAVGHTMGSQMTESVVLTKAGRIRNRRGVVLIVLSCLLSLGMYILGILMWKRQPLPDGSAVRWLLSGYALVVLLPLGNYVGLSMFKRKYNAMTVAQAQQFILSHREQAEETAARKLKQLCSQRRWLSVYALFLGLLGVGLAFVSGWAYQSDDWTVLRELVCAFLILVAFGQLELPEPQALVEEMDNVLSEEAYPNLYRMARKAAEKNGCNRQICVVADPVNAVGIARVNDMYLIRMGVLTMAILTEEELYAVLLHEFFHESEENEAANRELSYNSFVTNGRNPHVASNLTDLFYLLPDCKRVVDSELYRYAANIGMERRADAAMSSCAAAAAASLLKINYLELFAWEQYAQDAPSSFVGEEPRNTVLRDNLAKFLSAVESRQADWNMLTKQEIQSRKSTHPTVWARIQNLGFSELPRTLWKQTEEGQKALAYMDQCISDKFPNYQEVREVRYVKPLERVRQWEADGCPLVAEEYADIVCDLRALGRNKEAICLCGRAIEELSPTAASFARLIRGSHRLHCYDTAGLEDVYEAIRRSSNFIDEGLEVIGKFCCLMGLQEQLDEYREKAVTLGQQQKDEFSHLGYLTKRDNLSEEHLPEGMLEDILAHIAGVSQDCISEIYLVRKTISESFFTSAFVIRFHPDVAVETQEDVMHSIFCYLDTSTDWQFSLFSFEDAPKGIVERIPNSLVFKK